jgi:uncharacterized membrane protein
MVLLRRGLAGASIAWASALPLASLAASRPVSSVVYLLTLTVYAIGSVICHQRPERSFYLWSHQMPVCARCTGIYAGAALAVVLSPMVRTLQRRLGGSPRADTWAGPYAATVLALAALPTISTLIYEWTTGVTPSNAIRAASGLCLGIGVAALIQREVN